MTNRLRTVTTLLASLGLGMGAGLFWTAAGGPEDDGNRAGSVTGVRSEAGGSGGGETDEQKGVESVPPDAPEDMQDQTQAESQAVDIRGVQGTDGTSTQPENTIQSVSSVDGSIQSIRGIQGIDTVTIQNLEMVLRMQSRPVEPMGGVSTAAALMTMEGDPQEELEEMDGREELEELELEGS